MNCSAIQTTFLAPAGASLSGPVGSYTTDLMDFQFINGNLVRNAGSSLAIYQFDVPALKAFSIPGREGMRLELKFDAFNVFNHPGFILNNSNDALAGVISLPTPTVTDANGDTILNTNFNCTAGCVSPFSGLYLGANGKPLNISDFRSGRVDKNFGAPNFNGLGNPSATITPRKLQLAIRFPW